MLDRIHYLEKQIETERQVNKTIREHLKAKERELLENTRAVDDKREKQAEEMSQRNQDLLEKKDSTVADQERLKECISKDDDWREDRAKREQQKSEEEADLLQEK